MTIDGGATGGYWAMGNWVMDTTPITMMNRAITQAKMGRSMKNLDMVCCPYFAALAVPDAADAGADAGVAPDGPDALAAASGLAALACHGTGFTGAPPRSF